MKITHNKKTSVSFSGYRTRKILQSIKTPNLIGKIYAELYTQIKILYEQGYTNYYSGMADGFDMIASEVVLVLKNEGLKINLIAVIPFVGQELRYSETDKIRYKTIYENAASIIFSCEEYHDRCYLDRNDLLLANCSMVVCYYSGLRGGTMYTVNRAMKTELPIINIYDMIER